MERTFNSVAWVIHAAVDVAIVGLVGLVVMAIFYPATVVMTWIQHR